MAGLKAVPTTKPIKLMDGSTTGPTYLPFARKGNVLLGIKPWGLADGGRYGVPQTTYFAARLRSAPENGLFAEEDAKLKVVKLQANPPNLWDAWPGVEWQHKGKDRASTTIGILLKGKFDGDDDNLQTQLLDQIKEGKLAKKMAAYLVQLAGPDNLIMIERDIAKWLDSEYEPLIKRITSTIEKVQQVKSLMTQSIGEFGMEADVLKKAYAKTNHDDEVEDKNHDEGEDDFPDDKNDE